MSLVEMYAMFTVPPSRIVTRVTTAVKTTQNAGRVSASFNYVLCYLIACLVVMISFSI